VTPFAALLAATAADPATIGEPGGAAATIEVVLVLLAAATFLAVLARRIGIPYPILLVLGGLLLGFVPNLPSITLEPDVVFLLFLPPILFGAGYFTSIRDLKANLRPIGLLAVGLVLATIVAVGLIAQVLIPGIHPGAAFALGAIVAPPDAVAATAIFQRLGVPRRIVTILEGESLVNDATALVAYRFALAAIGGSFSLAVAGLNFVVVALAGIAIGIVIGRLTVEILRRIDDPVFSVVVTFIAPVVAYLPAEELGASGVLSAVAGGLVVGRLAPRLMSSEVRLAGVAAWQILLFLINGSVFILIGLQLPTVLEGLGGRPTGELIRMAVAIVATVILVRIAWVFPASYLPRWLSATIRARDPYPPARNVFLVSWAGMRGVVSLAAALALPVTIPERNLLIFLTFAVILATLVGQGLTLPLLIRGLRISGDGGTDHEEALARQVASEAAVARIEQLAAEWPGHLPLVDTLRVQYGHRASHAEAHPAAGVTDEAEQELLEHRQMRLAVIEAEREALIGLHERGAVSDEAFRRVERDLDLEELRMEA
jgi:CPA1 family monovalent cation:H+ antiporter